MQRNDTGTGGTLLAVAAALVVPVIGILLLNFYLKGPTQEELARASALAPKPCRDRRSRGHVSHSDGSPTPHAPAFTDSHRSRPTHRHAGADGDSHTGGESHSRTHRNHPAAKRNFARRYRDR